MMTVAVAGTARAGSAMQAKTDKSVSEEYGDSEDEEDEENIDFLTECAVCEGKGEIWREKLALSHAMLRG